MRIALISILLLLNVPMAVAQDSLLTHGTDFARVGATAWRAEPWRVENPDKGAQIVEVDGILAFVIAQPHKAMAWTLSTEPIWTDPFRTLAASYFVEGGIPEDAPPPFTLFDGSTGPITPGATNAENPLASGGRYACGTFSAGLHVEPMDLSEAENLDRVAEITITVESGDEPVVLRLNQLAFLASSVSPTGTEQVAQWSTGSSDRSFSRVPLPETGTVSGAAALEALGLSQPWPVDGTEIRIQELPFRIENAAVATPLLEGASIVMAPKGRGNVLALLIGTRLWGSAEAWYSSTFVPRRIHTDHPAQAQFVLTYEDGTIHQSIPQAVGVSKPGLWPGVHAYVIESAPDKSLLTVSIDERMSYGQVVLLAASRLKKNPYVTAPAEASSSPAVIRESVSLPQEVHVVEGEKIRVALDNAGIVHSFQLGAERHELVSSSFPILTLLDVEGDAVPLQFMEALKDPEQGRLVLLWELAGERACEMALEVRSDGSLNCETTLINRGSAVWELTAVLPRLTALTISRGGPPGYLLGSRSARLDTAPIDTAEVYGGRFPNQIMALHDTEHGGGLAYIVKDRMLDRKWFEFKLAEDGRANMAVSYRGLKIAPGERRALAPVVLLPHEGGWQIPFEYYRDWVRQAFPRRRANPMEDLFYCRRDYPLGGTNYLYNPETRTYAFPKITSESDWAFGGVDMVDISGWAYNESVGRVGTYRENDLGGLDALAKGVWTAHTRNVQVGLYFEGYLLDRRSANADRGLEAWQLIRKGGDPAWWPGEMEFFCCSGASGWQETLAGDIAAVAAKTKADAVYVDQLGLCDVSKECWSTKHGHPVPSNPVKTEIALLKRIRAELDKVRPECAIYIEHIPCDAMTPYIDGAFNLGMKHKRHPLGPTKLPLHRYLQPEVPIFEMLAHGIRPIPAEVDDLRLAFFHGMGLWLKGKGASWYSEGFRAESRSLYPLYLKFGAYFRSPEAQPHVPTLADGIYANRFPDGDNVVYTLYNATTETISGSLLALPEAEGGTVSSLVETVALTLGSSDNGPVLNGAIPPMGVAGVAVLK